MFKRLCMFIFCLGPGFLVCPLLFGRCVGLLLWGALLPLFCALFCDVCWGPCLSVLLLLLPALVVPVSVGLLPLCFPCVFPFLVLRGPSLLLLLSVVLVRLPSRCCPCVLGACGLARSLLSFPPPSPPPLVVLWRLLVQSVLCWSLPPGIWLYLQRSGCHTFGMACCG